jgi:hypothetical protein
MYIKKKVFVHMAYALKDFQKQRSPAQLVVIFLNIVFLWASAGFYWL